MSPGEIILWSAVSLLGLGLSAVYSGVETGSYCVNRVRLMVRAERADERGPDRRARLLRAELDHSDRLLGTLLISNNIANYLGAAGISSLLSGAGFSDWAIVGINAAVLTPLLFVVGETLPKDLFRAEADRLTYAFAPMLRWTRLLLTATLVLPMVSTAFVLLGRALGQRGRSEIAGARARVGALLKEGMRHGVLSEFQSGLVDRALALRERRVEEEMIPWPRVISVGADWRRSRVEAVIRRRLFTRLPVVDRRGRVVGMIKANDVWARPSESVRGLMTPIARLSPEMSVRDALRSLRQQGVKAAAVERADKPIGFATERDLIEPLISEMQAP